MKPLRALLSAAALAIVLAAPASAQILNGDFSAGGSDWNVVQPPNWTVSFPAAGGNPDAYGRIQSPFGNSGGTGSIFQTFLCGDQAIPGHCVITLDYRLDQLDASAGSARVLILVDGWALYASGPGPTAGWPNIPDQVPYGVHVLARDPRGATGPPRSARRRSRCGAAPAAPASPSSSPAPAVRSPPSAT